MILDVRGLKTHLENHGRIIRAVDDVSFQIEQGETFCLVGESGSGKSISALSVMQLLPAGISSHPSGQIMFQHHEGEYVDLLTMDDVQRRLLRGNRMSMIFQEPMTSLNPVYTIGDQLLEVLELHRPDLSYKDACRLTIEALRQVQIPEPEQRFSEFPHRLSGGQRQRVMIAMALICEPDLLIADEPTTALDVTVQAEILRLMRELQDKKGMAIFFISHDFGVVAQMASRVGVMRQGKIVETAPTERILRHPQHPYTKSLIAALPESLKRLYPHPKIPEHTDAAPLIRIRDLRVYFPINKGVLKRVVGHVKAVDGVDLDIMPGKILAVVGESGCGKTTLGRAILRLQEPTSGIIRYRDRDITELSRTHMQPLRRKMQFVFQDPASSLNPRLTVATILTEPMAVHSIGENEDDRIQRAQELLERVHLERNHLWHYPHEFSGGQRQRIGIARALALNPDFIVCDEITSALDVSVQAEILQLLLDLRQERNLTLLFITHNISVVEYIADDIAVMHDGAVVEYGTAAAVTGNPLHPYTKKLLAAVPRVQL